jgi:hypothetical protein
VGRSAYKIRRRWGHYDDVCFTGETDVIEGVPRTKNLGVNGPTGNRLEGDWSDELARSTSHHDVDLSSGLCKQTRQPH